MKSSAYYASVLLAAAMPFANEVAAQDKAGAYPTRPVRLIVPFPPGGSNDILARMVGTKLGEQFGQQVVIDNRGGAGSIIGTQIAANAPADGYTVLLGGTASLSINPSLKKSLPYDAIKDFAPVSLVATGLAVLAVHPGLPVKTVKDLIALAKPKPQYIKLASPGSGTPTHLSGELFNSMAGVDMLAVHYKGGGPANIALLSGEVNACFCGIASVMQYIKDGRLRAVAVTSSRRSSILPDVPTIAEGGVAGFEVVSWFSIVAPAGTPKPAISRLNGAIRNVLNLPDIKSGFEKLGVEPRGSTPEELLAYNRNEIAKWARAIKAAGIKPE